MENFKKDIIAWYKEGYGTVTICEKLKDKGCVEKLYPLKIQRCLKKWGVKIRNHSDAQKKAHKVGTAKNPTKGKKRTPEERHKIGLTLEKTWKNKTEEEKDKITQQRKEYWDSLSEKEKKQNLENMIQGRLKSAKLGSALERGLRDELRRRGYTVNFHMSVFGSEVDIFLPEVGFAIEIDGVSHHQPVWGEEVLQKTQLADSKKNGELLNNGISVVRVRNEKSTFAQIHVIKVADYLDKLIEQGRFKNQLVRVDLNEL